MISKNSLLFSCLLSVSTSTYTTFTGTTEKVVTLEMEDNQSTAEQVVTVEMTDYGSEAEQVVNKLKEEFGSCLESKYWTSAVFMKKPSRALNFLYCYAWQQAETYTATPISSTLNLPNPPDNNENKQKLLTTFMEKCELLNSQAVGNTENKQLLKEEFQLLKKVLLMVEQELKKSKIN